MSDDGVTIEVSEAGVAHLFLSRPAAGNALEPGICRELRDAAHELAARSDVRVVVFRTAGDVFCVGGDVRFFAGSDDAEAALRGLAGDLHDALATLAELDAPVIVRVQGVAAGAGMSLAAFGDVTVASSASSFTMAYTGVGLSPDGGSTWFLPRAVGQKRAAELMLTNRRVGAEEAARIGLVTEVVEPDELDARVAEVAERLAAGPTPSLGAVKRLLRESATSTLADQLRRETDSIATLAASPTGREGVDAFVNKRRPDFRGA